MSNSLDPDQARHLVGPDLDLNCLQNCSADSTGSQLVNKRCHAIIVLQFFNNGFVCDKCNLRRRDGNHARKKPVAHTESMQRT